MSISFDKELFRTRHLGPDPQQVTEMLSAIKADSLQQLMEETIPAQIRLEKPLNLPDALSEEEYLDYLRNEIASKNKIYKSFIGMGYYDTRLPNVILRNVLENQIGRASCRERDEIAEVEER